MIIRNIIFLVCFFPATAQQGIDSLWQQGSGDTYEDALTALSISKRLRDTNIKIAFANNQKAVSILENEKADSMLAVALAELGITYSYMADYENAFSVNHRALQLAAEYNDTLTQIDANNSIGIDYYYMEEFDKSLEYFEEVAKLALAYGESKRIGNAYNNLGLVYSELGNYEKELDYYNRAKEIHTQAGDKDGIAMTELNIGSVYLLDAKYADASKAFDRALQLYQSIQNKSGEFDVKSSIVTLYQETGRMDKAIELAEETLRDIRETQFKQTEKHYLELLESLYTDAGWVEKAYSALKDLKSLDEEIFSEQQSRVVAELETQYQTAQKEKEIASLAIENERASLLLEQEENRRKILFATIFILVLIALFFIWRYRYKQRIALILEDRNKIISESLEQRETLLKEIHHRVKNNLQIISSLLNLQSRFVKDPTVQDAVKEGRDRVKSMAMIHQKLYQNDDLTGVDIQDYISNLIQSLEKSYGIDPDQVQTKVEVDSMVLDIDTTIPLGLILNEIVSNSFKYAFPDDRKGQLLVKMSKEDDQLNLIVADDGVGKLAGKKDNQSGFGTTLIESLAEKLKAEYIVDHSAGTSYIFKIKQFKIG